MTTYATFDQKKIAAALEAAKAHHASFGLPAAATPENLSGMDVHAAGEYSVSGGCVSVSVNDGKVCIDLPLVGKYCLPVPSWIPNGAELKACVSLCTTFGIPTGVKLTVSFNGDVIFTKTFLKC